MEKTLIRVLSYNIHKGFTARNKTFVLNRIREAIRSVHADLVFLQEVLGAHDHFRSKIDDWPDEPQFEFLAHEIWPHFQYGKNAVYTSGHHGNAILSKYPFKLWENIDVSTNRLERRGLLHGVLELPGHPKPLHAVCVHLGLLEADRKKQVRELCDRIESHVPHDEPLVIAGDFNDWRVKVTKTVEKKLEAREAYKTLHGSHARTFPAIMPFLPLDRVYFRGAEIESANCLTGKPWTELSDHNALYVELAV